MTGTFISESPQFYLFIDPLSQSTYDQRSKLVHNVTIETMSGSQRVRLSIQVPSLFMFHRITLQFSLTFDQFGRTKSNYVYDYFSEIFNFTVVILFTLPVLRS